VRVIAVGASRGYRDTAVPMLSAGIGYWAIGFVNGWLLAFPLGLGAVGLLHFRARAQIRAAEMPLLPATGLPA
jgi:Na+-driven multidrug efflux pump